VGPRVLVAQLGARRHYAVARALDRVGQLERIVTELSADAPVWRALERIVPAARRPRRLERLLARRVSGVSPERISNIATLDLAPWLWRRPGEASSTHWARRNAAFGRRVAARGFGGADTVYAYNGAALESFAEARRRGLVTVLDQTAAPWRWNRVLLEEEAARWPGWETDDGEMDRDGVMTGREEAEWPLADAIVCGSAYVADTLRRSGVPDGRCHVVAYAGHVPLSAERKSALGPEGGPLRLLFVGTLQLRKGLPYLLEALRRLPAGTVELRLVGPSRLSAHATEKLGAVGEWVGAVPRSELAYHYAWADALVLPSLSEGSANVCYEAMAAGLTVITTANAGSIVRHEHDGIIVPIRDSEALAAAIASLADDRSRRAEIGAAARESMARATLERYAEGLVAAVEAARRQRSP
jgi:glycosyltransferase involved in cell wall biosynthesis